MIRGSETRRASQFRERAKLTRPGREQRRRRQHQFRCDLEVFESRQLLTVTSAVSLAGVLTITSDGPDVIELGSAGGAVQVNGADPDTGPALAATITEVEIQGGFFSNTIDLNGFDIGAFTSLGVLTISGGFGGNTLISPAGATTVFNVTGTDVGILSGPAFGSLPISTFNSIANLVGTEAGSTFAFDDAGSLTGSIHSGGQDILDFSATNTAQTVALTGSSATGFEGTSNRVGGGFNQIGRLVGGTGQDTLVGEGVDSVWTFDAAPYTYNDGAQTLEFEGFAVIQGGNQSDRFELTGGPLGQVTAELLGGDGDDAFIFHGFVQLIGGLDGQQGFDTLSYADFDTPVVVQLTGSDATGYSGTEAASIDMDGFRGINEIIAGDPATAPGILIGEDTDSLWNLGANPTYSDASHQPLGFTNFTELRGGAGVDTFQISADFTGSLFGGDGDDLFLFTADGVVVHGSIDGEGGINTLDLAGYVQPVQVDLTAESGSILDGSIQKIRNIFGGAGNDTLRGDANENILDGRGGDNHLSGEAGDDTLIGGAGNDTLEGGLGDDTYQLAIAAGKTVVVHDPDGFNALDFSSTQTAINLNLDDSAVQTIAPGRNLQLDGVFSSLMGTPFADVITVTAGPIPRSLIGGPAGTAPDNLLQVTTLGHHAVVTPSAVLFNGAATVTYQRFSQVILLDQEAGELTLSQSHSPNPATVGQNVVLVLTVQNPSNVDVAGVELTDILSPDVQIVSAQASQGTTQILSGTVIASLGVIPAGGQAQVWVTLRPLAAGTAISTATVRGEEVPEVGDTHRIPIQPQPPLPGPFQIINQFRTGYHWLPTQLVLRFNRPLNPVDATNTQLYTVLAPGRDGRFGTRDDIRIPIRAAQYNPNRFTVTLSPSRNIPLRAPAILTVRGLHDANGQALDGAGTGQPGTPYVRLFRGFNWVRKLGGWF